MNSAQLQPSQIHATFMPRNMANLRLRPKKEDITPEFMHGLKKLGMVFDESIIEQMMETRFMRDGLKANMAMDAINPSVTTGSIPVPVQFLQYWVPGFVYIDTAALKIDDFVGMSIVGQFSDAQIVQPIMELLGGAVPYGDFTNVTFSDWNVNYEQRTVIRFELGMLVGDLESQEAARARIDNSSMKREACSKQLEITRNAVGFYGYNNGANNTYGFLNDPGLPAYFPVPPGAGGSTFWADKTFLEIQNDINNMIVQLRTQSQDLIDPEKVNITLALATAVVDTLNKTSDFGISVRDWLKQTYPRVRVASAPELDAANGGENVGYLYAETVDDMSTDGGKVFDQWVPTKFRVQAVEQRVKGYLENYNNALAGVVCKRPWAVTRVTGI